MKCPLCLKISPALQWTEREDDNGDQYSFYECPLCHHCMCRDPGALDEQKLVERILAALDPVIDKNAIAIITNQFAAKE